MKKGVNQTLATSARSRLLAWLREDIISGDCKLEVSFNVDLTIVREVSSNLFIVSGLTSIKELIKVFAKENKYAIKQESEPIAK